MTVSRAAIRSFLVGLALLLSADAAAHPPKRKRHAVHARARSAVIASRPRPLELSGNAVRGNTAQATTEPERALQRQLDAILGSRWLKSAINGVYVVDAVTGQVLYSYGADRQLNPASNTKLISTATALAELGPDFTYQTKLVGPEPDDDGVISGDVYLVGSADPTLRASHLDELAAALKARGVTRIDGDLVTTSDDHEAVAHAYVRVIITGANTNGKPPSVRLSPDSGFFRIDNRGVTGNPKIRRFKRHHRWHRRVVNGIAVRAQRLSGNGAQLKIRVTGRIPRGRRVDALRGVPHPVLFTAYTMRAALVNAGIEVTGRVRQLPGRPAPPKSAVELASHDSIPLRELLARILKPSNNFLADHLILTVGELKYGGQRAMENGVHAMMEWLAGIGIASGSYRLENGSGLSHAIHISPRQLATVLLAGARDEDVGSDWVDSFAVGGIDGTLRSRFAGHPSAGYIRGKTGTLNGVSALSGFVTISQDTSVCFSILSSGFRSRRKQEVRESQAAIADAIFDYLRARRGDQPLPPPPDAAIVPVAGEIEPAATGDLDSEDQPADDDQALGNPGVEL